MSARTIWHRDSGRESDGVCTASDASSTGLTECFESCDLADFSSLTWLAILFFILDDARLRRSVDHWRRSSFTADGDQGLVSCSSSIICWPTDASPRSSLIHSCFVAYPCPPARIDEMVSFGSSLDVDFFGSARVPQRREIEVSPEPQATRG